MDKLNQIKSILTKHCGENVHLEEVDRRAGIELVRKQMNGIIPWGISNRETLVATKDGFMILQRVLTMRFMGEATVHTCVTRSGQQFCLDGGQIYHQQEIYMN